MIRRHSQRIVPPPRPETALALALKHAIERKAGQRQPEPAAGE